MGFVATQRDVTNINVKSMDINDEFPLLLLTIQNSYCMQDLIIPEQELLKGLIVKCHKQLSIIDIV